MEIGPKKYTFYVFKDSDKEEFQISLFGVELSQKGRGYLNNLKREDLEEIRNEIEKVLSRK